MSELAHFILRFLLEWVLKSKEFVLFDGIEMAPRSLFRERRGRRQGEVPGNPARLFWLV